jgi:GNAT superfamily N-acetyltransferase
MRIRLADNTDCVHLPGIESSASRRFADIGMQDLADQAAAEAEAWEPHCQSEGLWVSVDDQDRPFGFLASGRIDDGLFLYQIAVDYDRQRQGVGHALLKTAETAAHGLGLHQVVLTTFCDVPFNGPYYARRGYSIVEDADLPPALRPVMDAERGRWAAPGRRRCAMRKRV